MDSPKSDTDSSDPNRSRKFGLPDWMVHNIERLNISTDFEQYASSPPQTEDFLSEYPGAPDCKKVISHPESGMDVNVAPEPLKSPGPNLQISLEKNEYSPVRERALPFGNKPKSPLSPKQLSILDVLKCEDIVYSSPDTTPCVTPEPSPVPRRKLSGASTETVATNPKRWFYLGFSAEENKQRALRKGISESVQISRPKNLLGERQISDVLDARNNEIKAKIADGNSSVKLAISNFDLNAVSPTSW